MDNFYDVIFSKKHAGRLILALFLLLLFYPILELFLSLSHVFACKLNISSVTFIILLNQSKHYFFFFPEFWRCSFLSSPLKHEYIFSINKNVWYCLLYFILCKLLEWFMQFCSNLSECIFIIIIILKILFIFMLWVNSKKWQGLY